MSDTRKYVMGQKFYLAGSGVTSSSTSLTLTSFNTPDGVAITMTDIGTVGYMVLEPGSSNVEIISFTTVTGNVISGITRGLGFRAPYTAAGLGLAHSGSTTAILTNPPQLYDGLTNKDDEETINQVWTFASGATPIITTAPSGSTDAANKAYVDGVVTGGAADSNDTTKGLLERATIAEIEAGTATGSTTAPLAVVSGRLGARLYTAYAEDAGANDTYAITCAPVPTAYTAGMVITFKANTINTGACTINVNTLGAKSLKVHKDLDPQDGYIKAGQIVLAEYDGTNFQILSVSGKPSLSQSGYEIYAADAGANDTYVITLAPIPPAYVDGLTIHFKPHTANTGPATLNANSLGAISILRSDGSALADGDLTADKPVQVVYLGGSFYLQSPVANTPIYKSGTTTKDASDASTTQNIAHGLGRVPRYVRLVCRTVFGSVSVQWLVSESTYNGTTQSSQSVYINGATSTIADSTFTLNTATAAGTTRGVITVDSTNIIITWTKSGSATGIYQILWEAEA